MSQWQFRVILLGSVGLFALSVLLGRILPRPDTTPTRWIPDLLRSQSRLFILSFFFVFILVSIIGIIGFIGMFVFWSPAPKLYIAATIAKTVIYPIFAHARPRRSEWENACGDLEGVLDGIIIAVTLFGPARQLFSIT